MTPERLLNTSIEVLYLPKNFYTPKKKFWLRPCARPILLKFDQRVNELMNKCKHEIAVGYTQLTSSNLHVSSPETKSWQNAVNVSDSNYAPLFIHLSLEKPVYLRLQSSLLIFFS